MQASVAGLAAATVLASCSRGADKGAVGATVPTTARVTTTTDPYAVPPVIDIAYVNRVLAALDAAVGDVTRLVIRDRSVSPEAKDRLSALYLGEYLQLTLDSYDQELQGGLQGARPNPGNRKTTVSRLISATPGCIFVEASRDFSAVSTNVDPALSRLWVGLKPVSAEQAGLNPTHWSYVVDGFSQGRTQPENPCVAS